MSDQTYDFVAGLLAFSSTIVLGIAGLRLWRNRPTRTYRYFFTAGALGLLVAVADLLSGRWPVALAWVFISSVFFALAYRWYRWDREAAAKRAAEAYWRAGP